MKKLVFGFRHLLFDVEKGACFFDIRSSVLDAQNEFWFSTSFTSPIGIGERYVESKNAFWFLVFDVPIGPTYTRFPAPP